MKLVRVVTGTLLLSAISLNPQSQRTNPAVLGSEWQCLLVPTSFDGPGTIFSVSKDGRKSTITDLREKNLIKVRTGRVAIGTMTDDKHVNGGFVVSLLQKVWPGLGAKLSANGQKIKGATIEYSDVTEETTFDGEFNPVVDKWFGKNVKPDPDLKYFAVRGAYLAGFVHYDFSSSDLEGIGGEATFKSIFQGQASIERGSNSTYVLKQNFVPPIRVCIRASEIAKTRGLIGSADFKVRDRTGYVPEIKADNE